MGRRDGTGVTVADRDLLIDALLAHGDWLARVRRALATSGLSASASAVDVWEVLESHGLNGGAPRPANPASRTSPTPRKRRTYRPASYWRAEVERLEPRLAAAIRAEQPRHFQRYGRGMTKNASDAATERRIRAQQALGRARTMLEKAERRENA